MASEWATQHSGHGIDQATFALKCPIVMMASLKIMLVEDSTGEMRETGNDFKVQHFAKFPGQ